MITQINFVPFTDVLLVLLVIFMMTATILGNEGGLEMRLPRVASAEAQGEQPEGVVVTIVRSGRVYIDDEATASGDLVHRLASAANDRRTRVVIIRADRLVPYERVAHAIEAAKLAGLSDLALATELDLGGDRPAVQLEQD
ncbi:MAG TPA: biopolymer transporter ExbD [Armatimonadetes bacterium]|jgi:biopolymer transport protein ExbD|nr:biopolymer transporter ExbD [Armatimonadota bacterium]HHX42212.1 biopolymer transporter ExbD [Armatimonadota bacterium]HOM81690.1 biopolymer transporter ExbD [Armatimonadota bacterium]HOQ28470.1 biopolymer transporter ExbD [Armatimonadota bacterium]HPO72283.1 biopolymer transporter ExbD [Armatimonadota bacterium]